MSTHLLDQTSSDTLQSSSENTIVIINDDQELAETIRWEVQEENYQPLLITNQAFESIDDLIKIIPENPYGVICDHRLSRSGFANFYGSELVARLYDLKIPALLETQFYDIDSDVSIRKKRHKIPVVLTRDRINSGAIVAGLEICQKELNGILQTERKSYRNILRLVDINQESNETILDVIIPGWDPHKTVRLPLSLVHEWLFDFEPTIGNYLIARVNTGAENSEDLYFTDFEIAPEPEVI